MGGNVKKMRVPAYMLAGILWLLLLVSGCGNLPFSSDHATAPVDDSDSALRISVLNVGQADASLIQYKGKNMLIDTGDVDSREGLVSQLKKKNIKTLDIIIITHPHGDHMGGMAALFKNFTIRQIYDNGQAANTGMYRNYLKNIKSKNIPYKALKKGDAITFAGDIHFNILSPGVPFTKENTSGVSESGLTNNNSIVCRMTYQKISVMFTGDAQKEAEQQVLRDYQGTALQSDILKVGHHGSKTSSSPAFIKAVKPRAAVISCGANNQYKFPHKPTLDTLKKNHAEVYRTDQDGMILIVSDGTHYSIAKEH